MDASALIDQCHRMLDALQRRLPSIALALLAIAISSLVARVVVRVVGFGSGRFAHSPYLATVLARLARLAVMIVGVLIALTIAFPSFTTANLVQLLGISSVAIGFAFRDIFQNFLAGLLLLITRPFRIGDQIVFLNEEGTVEDIQTRATLIRTYDGRRVVIPNANLFTSPVIVNTAFPSRRMEIDFDCPDGRDVERTREAVRTAAAAVAGVIAEPPPDVILVGLAGPVTRLRVRWWMEPPRKEDAVVVRSRVLDAVRRVLLAA